LGSTISKGRALDNIFVERLWRTVKYEEVYIKEYHTAAEAGSSLKEYFEFYNNRRLHQALDYMTPAEVHCPEVKRDGSII
jgi:putative transposase